MLWVNYLYVIRGVRPLLLLPVVVAAAFDVNNPIVFYGVGALLVAYLLYMMIRKRKGERPGSAVREPEL
jgi:hypothetical protein